MILRPGALLGLPEGIPDAVFHTVALRYGLLLISLAWAAVVLRGRRLLVLLAGLLFAGALVIGIIEWENPRTLGSMAPAERVLNAVFESVTVRTAGFTVVDTAGLQESTLFLAMALMFIGTASGSSGRS